jgi:hypothetical protein
MRLLNDLQRGRRRSLVVNGERHSVSPETLQEGFLCPTRPGRPYPERRTGAANSCYPSPLPESHLRTLVAGPREQL